MSNPLLTATALRFAEEFNALERFARAMGLPIDVRGAEEATMLILDDVVTNRLAFGPTVRLTLKDAGLGLIAGNVVEARP